MSLAVVSTLSPQHAYRGCPNCFNQYQRPQPPSFCPALPDAAWNGAASGCATGLALGWKQGPMSALQVRGCRRRAGDDAMT